MLMSLPPSNICSIAAQPDHATVVPSMVPTNGSLKSQNKLALVSLMRPLNLTLPALLIPPKVSAQRSTPPANPSMSLELAEAFPKKVAHALVSPAIPTPPLPILAPFLARML